MDIDVNIEWVKVQLMVRKKFEEILDIQSILFIIGLQELGMNYQEFKKEQKIDIIHIGVCTVLMPFGYYKKIGLDNDGWPHFKNVKKIPNTVVGEEQDLLIKRAIIKYFNL
ncbi:MAG: hypothetical protein H6587_07825 [Flavobacteriales bacterium]|nr:hypothetical protein [Flavobacteriales bacterium]MCB9364461.1 hypothetical protein [Flavobacteriales bacterium]